MRLNKKRHETVWKEIVFVRNLGIILEKSRRKNVENKVMNRAQVQICYHKQRNLELLQLNLIIDNYQ